MLDFVTNNPRQTALLLLALTLVALIQGLIILSLQHRLRNLEHKTSQLEKTQKFLNQVYLQDMPIPPVPDPALNPDPTPDPDPASKPHRKSIS